MIENESPLKHILQPKEKDLGEFSVRRVLPAEKQNKVGPWIFFDHMGPAKFAAGKGINVRPHPHINLATVTYLFDGEIFHRDSLGYAQAIKPGDINLMVAGKGITHSERERPEVNQVPHSLHGLQLWLALPQTDEEIEPAFYHYPASDIPSVTIDDVPIRVLIGSAYGLTSPVKTFAETLYVEAKLQSGQNLVLPQADEIGVYVVQGEVRCGNDTVTEHTMAVMNTEKNNALKAKQETRVAIVGGERLGPRFLEWNFVSSRKERIEQAKLQWKTGQFPMVVGDTKEFIPLPE